MAESLLLELLALHSGHVRQSDGTYDLSALGFHLVFQPFVNMATGQWIDNAAPDQDVGRDLISLYARVQNCSNHDAAIALMDWLGWERAPAVPMGRLAPAAPAATAPREAAAPAASEPAAPSARRRASVERA